MRTYLLLASAVGLMACGDRDFNKPARLDKPRILAIKADPPQPSFGVATTLSTLLYQPPLDRVTSDCPNPAETTYEWSWCPWPVSSNDNYACPLPEQSFQALYASLGLGQAPAYAIGNGATVSFTNPFSAGVLYALCRGDIGSTLTGLASMAGIDGGAGTSVFDCDLPATDYNVDGPAKTTPIGFKVNVMVKVTPACPSLLPTGFSPLTAVYALHLPTNDGIPVNHNPNLAAVALPNLPTGVARRDQHVDLQLGIDIAESEHLAVPGTVDYNSGTGETRHYEHLSFAWYAEAGDFRGKGKGDTTGYLPTAQPPGEDAGPSVDDLSNFAFNTSNQWDSPKQEDYSYDVAAIIVVVRDGRGGVGWASTQVSLETTP
jgi:hypothetical protein